MPLVAAALLTYICGLFAAAGGVGPAALFAGLLMVWWAGRALRERVALGAMLAAGAAAGFASSSAIQRCEQGASASRAIEAVIDDDANPGAFVPARLDCGVTLRVAVRE